MSLPLDSSKHPRNVAMGNALKPITGVVAYEGSRFTLLPLTAAKFLAGRPPMFSDAERAPAFGKHNPLHGGPLSSGEGDEQCEAVTIVSYNLHGFGRRPDDGKEGPFASMLARHIVTVLHSPDIIFLQELNPPSLDALGAIMRSLCSMIEHLNKSTKYRWITKASAHRYRRCHHHKAHPFHAVITSQTPDPLRKLGSSIVPIRLSLHPRHPSNSFRDDQILCS